MIYLSECDINFNNFSHRIEQIYEILEQNGFVAGCVEKQINIVLSRLKNAEQDIRSALVFNRKDNFSPEVGDEVRVDGYGVVITDSIYPKVLVDYTRWYKVLYYGPRWIHIESESDEKIEMARNSVLEVRKPVPTLGQFKLNNSTGLTEVFRFDGWAVARNRGSERRKINDRLSKGLQVVSRNVYAGIENRNTLNCMLSLARTTVAINNLTLHRFNDTDRRKKV